MALDRTERLGVGVAAAAHIALFIALSLSWSAARDQRFDNPPMAVDIVAEAAPESSAPVIAAAPPPPRGLPDEPPAPSPATVVVPAPPSPQPVRSAPQRATSVPTRRAETPRPAPTRTSTRPQPSPAESDKAKPSDEDTRPRRRPDRPAPSAATPLGRTPTRPARAAGGDPLGDIASSVTRAPPRPNPAAAGAPAARTATEIRRSISTSINAEVARPWNACRVTGIDVDALTTTVVFRLTESGALDRITAVTTTGVNDSNRPQQQRFEECARRAIELAAPFNLPAENYSYWQTYTLDFQKRH